jgi:flagellar hook-associated protein 2
VSSGITFSGFNNIDFGLVLNAIMQAESVPLTNLQKRQTTLKSQVTNLGAFSSKITALQTAAAALSTPENATPFKASSSDATAVTVSAGSSAVSGRYDVNITTLARAQVTASANAAPDATTTTVATGGSITIGGETIAISSAMTLKQLSEAINANADAPARAAVVQSGTNSFKLVLTAKNTGADHAFTVTDNLTGGAFDLAFTDTDSNGVIGDSVEDNAVQASDAALTINNIPITSAGNTLDAAIPGASLTLLKENSSVVVDVSADPAALKTKVQNVVTAYNDLVKFMGEQNAAAAKGDQTSIGREAMLRGLRNTMRSVFSAEYDMGGAFSYLAQIGLEMTTSGTMQLRESKFNDAVKNGTADVSLLLGGATGVDGAFTALEDALKTYTQNDGFVSKAQNQINSQITKLGTQVDNMQARLAIRRSALQAEFTAADAAMTLLRSQSGSLSNLSF